MQKIINFIFNKIAGLFFLLLFCFSFFSLISLSFQDPYFGNFSTNENVNNLLGFTGSYFAGSAYAFLGLVCYLIPFFFLIYGFKKIFGIHTKQFLLRLISFVVSIILLCLALNYWSLNVGVLGRFLSEVTNELDYLSTNQYILFLSMFRLKIGKVLEGWQELDFKMNALYISLPIQCWLLHLQN